MRKRALLFGLGLAVVGGVAGYLYGPRVEAVGVYACTADLTRCERLVWRNSLTQCREARREFASAPTEGELLVCVRESDFLLE